jgi:hypothetical protein
LCNSCGECGVGGGVGKGQTGTTPKKVYMMCEKLKNNILVVFGKIKSDHFYFKGNTNFAEKVRN